MVAALTFDSAAVSTAISEAAGLITGLISTNLPVILGVVVAFVGLSIAKRFIRGLAS